MDESRDQVELVPVHDRLSGEILMSGGSFSHVNWAMNRFPSLARTGGALSFLRDIDPASKEFCSSCRRLA